MARIKNGNGNAAVVADSGATTEQAQAPEARAAEADAAVARELPEPSVEARTMADLKLAVAHALRDEAEIAEALRLAKERSGSAEHELCSYIVALRKGDKKNVEIEIDGCMFKPKFVSETKRYRLDRAPSSNRVTI